MPGSMLCVKAGLGLLSCTTALGGSCVPMGSDGIEGLHCSGTLPLLPLYPTPEHISHSTLSSEHMCLFFFKL